MCEGRGGSSREVRQGRWYTVGKTIKETIKRKKSWKCVITTSVHGQCCEDGEEAERITTIGEYWGVLSE